ncbi:TIGR00299 family protein [Candidatus Nitrososphaera evergladensis SR1]|uniref:TIGR00299 family protein n=1 Tax=Candidatus Nitrososphaera evergladensis SR1 TaxID=1459636 RepID=A0A075MTC0_9ARCH|nr:nickel pincer cofactor biosynthesis protein LarC [Candidatus Nitrososphaera evergladensis]AIF84821.1 TIGR00299 family protein [Candidatus Nitrososphaera evergladensis SR1]
MTNDKIAVIDCQVAGIAGDMLVSALVDAGASAKKVRDAIFACQDSLKGSKISNASFEKIVTHGFSATQLQLSYKDGVHERKGAEMLRALTKTCDTLDLEQRAKAFALDTLKTIVSAEARVHGEDFSNVHLHEASSVDTLADIVGCATALQDLSLFGSKIVSTQVAVGGGKLTFSHGTVPNPADAILHIFQGRHFALAGGQAKEELTTPTGAALLANLAEGSVDYYPTIVPEKIGYGAGGKKFEGFANVVRVLIGSSPVALEKDTVCVVETNVDDATGEVMGNLIDRLTDAGAKDVTIIPGTTKKNRPTYLVRVVADNFLLNAVLSILFSESGTLGARVQQVERYVLQRAVVTVPVTIGENTFNVHVKVAKDAQGNTMGAKPEFEDIKIIAARLGVPARRVMEIVNAQVVHKV